MKRDILFKNRSRPVLEVIVRGKSKKTSFYPRILLCDMFVGEETITVFAFDVVAKDVRLTVRFEYDCVLPRSE